MRDKAIRRIPVVKNGKPVGILSLGDLALQRDPFSALGAISKASPNNEINSEVSLGERSGNDRPSVARTTPTVRLAAVRR